MQIDAIELFHLALPLRKPQKTAGREVDSLETVLLRIRSGDAVGWAEAGPCNAPVAAGEWAGGAFACLKDWLAPAVVGTAVDSGDDLAERLAPFRGNRFAKAALDMAWWDLRARIREKPLHELLDGQRRTIEIGPVFDEVESIEDFLQQIGRALDDGFTRVKLMVRPGWDVQMIDFVRKEFPVAALHADVEGGMGLQHMDSLCRLDDFGLEMIEQPLPPDDLVGSAMVQDSLHTPICLDEGVTTPEHAEQALDLKSCRFMNVHPGRLGGLTAAVAVGDACRLCDVPCFAGAMPQSSLAARFELALAARANFDYPADYFPAADVLAEDVVEPLRPTRDGPQGTMQITLWSEPGIGVEPDPKLLERFCIEKERIG